MNRLSSRGYALLALLLVVFVSGSSFMIGALGNRQSQSMQQQSETLHQLALAKERLLAYAASSASLNQNAIGPGFFPCPDTNSTDADPQPDATCDSNAPLVGRLPQHIDLASQRYEFGNYNSGIDQQFWLIVAPRYVYHSTNSANQRRSYTRTHKTASYAEPYRLHLDGAGQFVAFIIAPGEALDTQNRTGSADNYANYLDGQNGANGFDYYSKYDANPSQFNDLIIGITHDEYMQVVGSSVATSIKNGLETYHATWNYYPVSSSSSTTFESQFNGNLTWLRRSSLGNGERWADTPNDVTWVRSTSDNDQGTLTFGGCTGITWFLNKDNESITRSGTAC